MPQTQEKYGIFISYSFEIESLARKLRDKLQVLDEDNRLDVFIASELGGRRWREEIDQRLSKAHLLILPFPYQAMKLDWVCFELGRLNRNAVPVSIMNTHLAKPPEQLAEWEAFRAETDSLRQFFEHMFDRGTFTAGERINPKIISHPEYRQRLNEAVAEIQTEFAAFRVEERLYTRRITISSPPVRTKEGALTPARLSFDTAVVHGGRATLDMFQIEEGATWRALKGNCETHSSSAWLGEVEQLPKLAQERMLARTLTPFRDTQKSTYIPVISKIESIEKVPSRVSVIFVEVSRNVRIGPEVFGNFDAMPPAWGPLFIFLDVARRFRWETLTPARNKLAWEIPADAPRAAWEPTARQVQEGSFELQRQLRGLGITSEEQFYGAYSNREISDSLRTALADYPRASSKYGDAIAAGDRAHAMEEFGKISRMNAVFIDHTLRQLGDLVAKLN